MALGSFIAWVDKNFLMIGLCLSLSIGLIFPAPGLALKGVKLGSWGIPQFAVVLIFILSGVALQSPKEFLQPKALIMGGCFVLFITPLIGWPILHFCRDYVQLTLLQGMALFCAVPTTLSSGVAMVQQANGNVPLALFLTTVTNLAGVFTMPVSMSLIFESTVSIDIMNMLYQLVCLTLLPLGVGMIVRKASAGVEKFAKTHKKTLTKMQNCCIFSVVWIMASGAQKVIMSTPPLDLFVCAVLACLVHVVYRLGAWGTANAAKLPEKEWVTVVLMCSQKSLPVCVSVLSCLPAELQPKTGLLIIPCIMGHFSQLMIDGFLTIRWTIPDEQKKEPLLPS